MMKDFYSKQIEYHKFFEKKKKISFDTSDKFLEIIDALAEVTGNNRTVIINALLGGGMAPFIKNTEQVWTSYLEDLRYEKIRNQIKTLIERLKKLKEKYQIK